jgi:hypothetical protein
VGRRGPHLAATWRPAHPRPRCAPASSRGSSICVLLQWLASCLVGDFSGLSHLVSMLQDEARCTGLSGLVHKYQRATSNRTSHRNDEKKIGSVREKGLLSVSGFLCQHRDEVCREKSSLPPTCFLDYKEAMSSLTRKGHCQGRAFWAGGRAWPLGIAGSPSFCRATRSSGSTLHGMGTEAFNPLIFLRQCMRAGTYKIPTANDIPLDLRVTLLRDAPCRRTPQVSLVKLRDWQFLPLWLFCQSCRLGKRPRNDYFAY